MKYLIIANWKQHKTISEARTWLKEFNDLTNQQSLSVQIVICPPFPLLPIMKQALENIKPACNDAAASGRNANLTLGAQNISQFESCPYTGAVGPLQLKDLVKYVIVGHSERREHFGETDDEVAQKVKLCIKHNLIPIICISDLRQINIFGHRTSDIGHRIIAYEPLTAISTGPVGKPDTPEHAAQMALAIQAVLGQNTKVLYGGSVDEENIARFLRQKAIEGALVGQASLDAKKFAGITKVVETFSD